MRTARNVLLIALIVVMAIVGIVLASVVILPAALAGATSAVAVTFYRLGYAVVAGGIKDWTKR